MIEGPTVDGLGREGGALVLGMAGLPADAAPVPALRRRRLGRLDDVRRGGLEEVEESLRAAASCWPSWATTSLRAASSASKASTRACS